MCIAHYRIHKKNGHILKNPGVNYLYIFYLFPSTTFIFPELSFLCSFSQMFCAVWKVKVAGQKREGCNSTLCHSFLFKVEDVPVTLQRKK